MTRTRELPLDASAGYAALVPRITERCRAHGIARDLVRGTRDFESLLRRIYARHEQCLAELPGRRLGRDVSSAGEASVRELRSLMKFAREVAELQQEADATGPSELDRLNAELQRVAEAEDHARRRLDDLLSALDTGVVLVGRRGSIETANDVACELIGRRRAELIGQKLPAVLRRLPREQESTIDLGGRSLRASRYDLTRSSGFEVLRLSPLDGTSPPHLGEAELQRLVEAMRRLGQLCHKINNPLTSLLGRAQILARHGSADPQVQKAAQVIEESSRRVADYVRELAREATHVRDSVTSRLADVVDEAAG